MTEFDILKATQDAIKDLGGTAKIDEDLTKESVLVIRVYCNHKKNYICQLYTKDGDNWVHEYLVYLTDHDCKECQGDDIGEELRD